MNQVDQRNRVWRRLGEVERPARYLGGELNTVTPQNKIDIRFCLLFPDLYEIGISYHGFDILYHVINGIEGVGCERSYLPWPDMQRLMSNLHIPLYGLESGTELSTFDVIGITLQTEMHYPGVLKALDLAGIPRMAIDRDTSHPLIIGGGPCAFHPEPIASFFDAFILGDGEEVVRELITLMRSKTFRNSERREQWFELSEIDGVYAPGLYLCDQEDQRIVSPINGVAHRIRARTVEDLRSDYYPTAPIVPFVGGTHDRLTVEIMRGCTQGCRFCQAGMLHRPVRERSVEDLMSHVMESLVQTGYNEVGLLSLSTSDYSHLPELMAALNEKLTERRVTLSFPSLRPASFTEKIAGLHRGGRKSGLTFAVEAGSKRLRSVINKALTEDELLAAIERAYRHGWKNVKLYFMVGLPSESDDDIVEGAELLRRIEKMVPKGRELHLSVSPFIPKPQSVFEGEAFPPPEEQERRQRLLYSRVGSRRVKPVRRESRHSQIEAIISRGDRRMAQVIEEIANTGNGFESWGGMFDAAVWYQALDRNLPDWKNLLQRIGNDEPRPWSHLTKGISPKFLREDLSTAFSGGTLHDCKDAECYNCGLMKKCDSISALSGVQTNQTVQGKEASPAPSLELDFEASADQKHRYRLVFDKLRHARYLGHHDLMRSIIRTLIRIGIPLRYSKGFRPRPLLSYGPAIALGHGAINLWVEFESERKINIEENLAKLRVRAPKGIRISQLIECLKGHKRTESDAWLRLRFNLPLQQVVNGGLKALRGINIESDHHGRTLYFPLSQPNGSISDLTGAVIKEIQERSRTFGWQATLVSVTRIL